MPACYRSLDKGKLHSCLPHVDSVQAEKLALLVLLID